jgi:PLP dependent protein
LTIDFPYPLYAPFLGDPMSITENYRRVCERMAETAIRCGRNPEDITLIAVTKNCSWDQIQPVYLEGARYFGESRLQEALVKQLEAPSDIQWHFIGTLQKNKVRKAIGRFALIHSVDSPELARKIASCSEEKGVVTPILLQANTSGEVTKSGRSSEEWKREFTELLPLPGITIEGLMTMAPLVDDATIIRRCFAELRRLREDMISISGKKIPMHHLSMGMSQDFTLAIEEGATLVRIGTAIFIPK